MWMGEKRSMGGRTIDVLKCFMGGRSINVLIQYTIRMLNWSTNLT